MPEIKYVSQEYVSYYPQVVDLVDPPRLAPIATLVNDTSVSHTGTNTVSVSFTPAVTGGVATSYKVTTYLVPNYKDTTYVGTGTTSPITVSGLGSDAIYRFKVQGINAGGTGPVSYASNSVGFGGHSGEDDEHDKTNEGEAPDGHTYYWDDKD